MASNEQESKEEPKPEETEEKKEESSSYKQAFTLETSNKGVQQAKYAVRGAIVQRAGQLKSDLKTGKLNSKKCGFSSIIFCNIGNPHAVGQVPLTFHRQVLAGVLCPSLIKDKSKTFPNDVKKRAKKLLSYTSNGSIGAYTTSMGMIEIRQNVAKFIEKRDGIKSNANNIFLSNGASSSIKCVFTCLITDETDAFLVPIPQYPLYSATITYKKGTLLGYELDESKDWAFDLEKTKEVIKNAKEKGLNVKGIVVINPGNPTGQCFSKKTMQDIIEFAFENNIAILADEVYQENVYDKKSKPFISFKKMIKGNKNKNIADNVELISFHSTSKGVFGECGLRGGYMELTNINEDIRKLFLKFVSINLCPSTIGQCMVDLMVKPPTKQTCKDSYKKFKKEWDKQYESLKKRARIISKELNKVKGITCNNVYGAMYAFPTITITEKAINNLNKKFPDKQCDFVYCMELLETYGICVVPGSGFKQKKNTFHFRTTLLPPIDQIKYVTQSISKFHSSFIKKYEEME